MACWANMYIVVDLLNPLDLPSTPTQARTRRLVPGGGGEAILPNKS